MKFIEHRIGDRRFIGLIQKWLKDGVLEEGQWTQNEEGTPQGGLISPVLANIYLHYAFDLWAHQWRKQQARGEVILVRYADNFFLGFTHICSWNRHGRFCVLRQTMTKRMRAKLKAIQIELKKRIHHLIPEQGKWLRMVLQGHYQYYGVPRNHEVLRTFRYYLTLLWKRALERRSQRNEILWERMNRIVSKYLPNPRICHPYLDIKG